jgi:hypothetical protein
MMKREAKFRVGQMVCIRSVSDPDCYGRKVRSLRKDTQGCWIYSIAGSSPRREDELRKLTKREAGR